MNVHDDMSDAEVLRAAAGPLSAIPVASPPDVEAIMARGRTRRRRRRIPGATGALALAAGVALAVTTLLPSGHQPVHPAQLAAWTVTRQGDGGIRVTIHELRDPAALQRTLRADGVPVSVTFTGQANLACQPYNAGGSPGQHRHLLASMVTALPGHGNLRVLVIHPSAFPADAGLAIAAGHPHQASRGGGVELTIGPPVKASPQCTGS
ncbi:MAG TPA: hypothetical protein VGM53_03220 [Streptosporangiaceae bacterium]|jgi:hypothetical protein